MVIPLFESITLRSVSLNFSGITIMMALAQNRWLFLLLIRLMVNMISRYFPIYSKLNIRINCKTTPKIYDGSLFQRSSLL